MRISDWSSDVCSSDLPISFRTLTRSYLAFLRGSARNAFARADPFLVEPPGNGGDRPAIAPAEAISAIGDAQRTAQLQPVHGRSEERRVGKECVHTGISGCSPYNYKKKKNKKRT